MPNRILRNWTDSDAVNSLCEGAEILFVRLIMVADDFGRFHASPRLVRCACLPLREASDSLVGLHLEELERAGLIRTYEVSGRKYLEICKFGQRKRDGALAKFPGDKPDPAPQSGGSRQPAAGRGGSRRDAALDVGVDVDVDGDEDALGVGAQPAAAAAGGEDVNRWERGGIPGEGKAEERQGTPTEAPPGFPRTEDEAVAMAANAGVPDYVARVEYNRVVGLGFRSLRGAPVEDWGRFVRGVYLSRVERLNEAAEKEKAAKAAGGKPASVWETKQRLEAVEREVEAIKKRGTEDAGLFRPAEKDRARYGELLRVRKELNRSLIPKLETAEEATR